MPLTNDQHGPNPQRTSFWFSAYLWMVAAVVLAFAVVFAFYSGAEARLERAVENREASLRLVNELRQTSNDLTRMVRTYVITGEPLFKQQFQDLIAIRDGKKPRPVDYSSAYWDFLAVEPDMPEPSGVATPLLELMRKVGFTEQEFAKLAESNAKSDALIQTELEAMALMEAEVPTDEHHRRRAIEMLTDAAFHQAKADIMSPLHQVDHMVQARTRSALEQAEALATMMRNALLVLGVLLALVLWKLSRQLYAVLGCSVPELHQTIARLGSGDFSEDITVPKGKENSVLGWLATMRANLAKLELRHFKAIVDSSDDAIISKTTEGIITSWNPGAERIFGYSAAEVIGRPLKILIPADRAAEEPKILARIASGERVEHFETVRRRKDGRLINISATISPIRDHAGQVVGASKIARDITKAKEAETEIHRLAFYDALTRLPNRRLLQDRLDHAMTSAKRTGLGFAILFIDLDNFKALNETQGHDVGDLLLKQVAHRLVGAVRKSDSVARFGGDEFVMILENLSDHPDTALALTEVTAGKILDLLSQPYHVAGYEYHCSSSIGITLFSGQTSTSDELLKQADLAMSRAKSSGRCALRFFDPEMQSAVDRHALLERELREALSEQHFVLYYQPQVVGDGQVSGVEALVRWHSPERGMVSPAEFIPLAEETGQILALGQWVLEAACTQLALWAFYPERARLTIAVNVSARQFLQPDFVAQVKATLDRTGADPHRLKLELTESMLVSHVEEIIGKMQQLKDVGVSFSLDDFGTGYSSLTYLKRLPLDQLKIDQGFVRDILTDPNDSAIAKMVVALAESMGIDVIAEGVESEAQQALLAELGCHAYQGYLFSKPLPIEALEQYLSADRLSA